MLVASPPIASTPTHLAAAVRRAASRAALEQAELRRKVPGTAGASSAA